MKRFIVGKYRRQIRLLPDCLDGYITIDNPVRHIEVFVDELDLTALLLPMLYTLSAHEMVRSEVQGGGGAAGSEHATGQEHVATETVTGVRPLDA